jgi:hypothetical protein
MKRGWIGAVSSALLAATLIACGGSGTSGGHNLSQTGRAVQSYQLRSLLSMAIGGIPFPGFTGGGTGGSTGSGSTGGGFGFPSMGGFLRGLGGTGGTTTGGGGMRSAFGHFSRGVGTTGGTTTTTTGGTDTTGGGDTSGGTGTTGGWQPSFYYDEWLMLWVQFDSTAEGYSFLFYGDEAKHNPAGHMTSTVPADWNVYPQTYSADYAYTAGTLAGSHGTYQLASTSPSDGSMTYQDVYGDTSSDQGQAVWDAQHSTWTSEWNGPNSSSWYHDSGDWNADGSGTYQASTSDGWSMSWVYNADWSGHAHFEGPDPKLPADLTWTSDGHYHIRYADGSTEDWNYDDLWGGTTGVGSSSSSGSTGAFAARRTGRLRY